MAQLMIVVDATIVNIALPSAQADLGFDDADRQWVITAYLLAFGSLLLLGGRISDIVGRKRMFLTGLIGFAAASALGGAAPSFEILIVGRVLQGVFAAALAPSALSTLTTVFAGSPDRGKAFGIFAGTATGGGALGLLLGGILTEYLSWRWCMYVNVPVALGAALVGVRQLVNQRSDDPPGIDFPGACIASLGVFTLVYGLSNAERDGWGAPLTLACFVGAAALLAVFVTIESRSRDPLLPLRVVADRVRGTSYYAVGTAMAIIFGTSLLLTFYLQSSLGMSPVQAGLAFLPMTIVMVATSITANAVLLARVGPRPLIPTGMALASLGVGFLAFIDVDSSYWTAVLPGLIACGCGLSLIIAPSFASATLRVQPRDTGVASAMLNTSQQIGGAIGTALLSTVAASAAGDFITGPPTPALRAEAAVHGYAAGLWVGAGLLALGAIVTAFTLRGVRAPERAPAPPRSSRAV